MRLLAYGGRRTGIPCAIGTTAKGVRRRGKRELRAAFRRHGALSRRTVVFIDAIDTSGSLTVQGWAFVDEPRPGGDYSDRFSFNGRRFDRVDYPLERKDVGDCFRARQRAKDCGFVLVASRIQAAPWR